MVQRAWGGRCGTGNVRNAAKSGVGGATHRQVPGNARVVVRAFAACVAMATAERRNGWACVCPVRWKGVVKVVVALARKQCRQPVQEGSVCNVAWRGAAKWWRRYHEGSKRRDRRSSSVQSAAFSATAKPVRAMRVSGTV